jgi:replicative DNA helicase
MKQNFKGWLDETWDGNLEADFPTKHTKLNEFLRGGWRRQHLTILAGRPSMGKTTYGVDEAVFLAREGRRVGICSIERPGTEIVDKVCTNYSGGDPRPEGLRATLEALPIWIDDSGAGLTASRIRHLVEEDPVDILVIDYLQLMGHEKKFSNRNDELDAVLQELQSIHKDYELQMLLLSQLNRGVEFRRSTDDHARPELGDLRDSGAIEQTADEVLLLHREDYYREFKKGDGLTEIIVAKNRLGPTGTVRLTFVPEEEAFI